MFTQGNVCNLINIMTIFRKFKIHSQFQLKMMKKLHVRQFVKLYGAR